jgi:hypothetical protein
MRVAFLRYVLATDPTEVNFALWALNVVTPFYFFNRCSALDTALVLELFILGPGDVVH